MLVIRAYSQSDILEIYQVHDKLFSKQIRSYYFEKFLNTFFFIYPDIVKPVIFKEYLIIKSDSTCINYNEHYQKIYTNKYKHLKDSLIIYPLSKEIITYKSDSVNYNSTSIKFFVNSSYNHYYYKDSLKIYYENKVKTFQTSPYLKQFQQLGIIETDIDRFDSAYYYPDKRYFDLKPIKIRPDFPAKYYNIYINLKFMHIRNNRLIQKIGKRKLIYKKIKRKKWEEILKKFK